MGRVSANIIVHSLCRIQSGCKHIHAIVNLFTAAMNTCNISPRPTSVRNKRQYISRLISVSARSLLKRFRMGKD